jgi:hypothetical protein
MGIINPYANRPDRVLDESGPEIRLLVCGQCKTIEVLDDYTGPQELAELYDTALNTLVAKHRDGVEQRPHAPAQLFRVKESSWSNPPAQEQIRQQIIAKFDPNAETGLGAEAYALRDTFKEDAFACWEKHLRNPGCGDYKTDKMRLTPNTQAERKEAGMEKFDPSNPATQRFLCEYCPVHSLVTQMKRERGGLYDQ